MLTSNTQTTVQPHQATEAVTPDTPGHVTSCTAAAYVFLVIINQLVCSIVDLVMCLLLIIEVADDIDMLMSHHFTPDTTDYVTASLNVIGHRCQVRGAER